MNVQTKNTTSGYLLASITIIFWSTTFVSTKILLQDFEPLTILLIRFVMGFILLIFLYPHCLPFTNLKHEAMFAMAGLSGITLYYLLENIALTYTLASNVSVITSSAPCFTALLALIFLRKEEKLHLGFIPGFILAILGICLISFGDGSQVHINPIGDLLAVLAAFCWGIYSVFIRKISDFGYNTIQVTRRTFAYGILFMLPAAQFLGFHIDIATLLQPVNLGNFLYLGFGASGICFVTWNMALGKLGAIKTSIFIYIIPVITVIASFFILHERMTPMAIGGMCLALLGLVVSERG